MDTNTNKAHEIFVLNIAIADQDLNVNNPRLTLAHAINGDANLVNEYFNRQNELKSWFGNKVYFNLKTIFLNYYKSNNSAIFFEQNKAIINELLYKLNVSVTESKANEQTVIIFVHAHGVIPSDTDGPRIVVENLNGTALNNAESKTFSLNEIAKYIMPILKNHNVYIVLNSCSSYTGTRAFDTFKGKIKLAKPFSDLASLKDLESSKELNVLLMSSTFAATTPNCYNTVAMDIAKNLAQINTDKFTLDKFFLLLVQTIACLEESNEKLSTMPKWIVYNKLGELK